MKKRDLKNLKLKKRTISKLDMRIHGGAVQQAAGAAAADVAAGVITGIVCTIYSYFQCDDIIRTSKDDNGKKCDIATINDSCFSLCDDKCNDF